jgi:hypothetical protein
LIFDGPGLEDALTIRYFSPSESLGLCGAWLIFRKKAQEEHTVTTWTSVSTRLSTANPMLHNISKVNNLYDKVKQQDKTINQKSITV